MSDELAHDTKTGIAIRYAKEFDILHERSYTMTMFGCGLSFSGWGEEVNAAIKRHHYSGCKKCRRYNRRMVALHRAHVVRVNS